MLISASFYQKKEKNTALKYWFLKVFEDEWWNVAVTHQLPSVDEVSGL